MAVEIPEDRVRPGDIIAFDFEILTTQMDLMAWAIRQAVDAVAAHPILDVQTTRVTTMGDVKLGRDVRLLRVWAKVRETSKDTGEQVQEASAAQAFLVIGSFIAGVATTIVLRTAKKDLGYTIQRAGEAFKEGMKWTTLLALIFLAYTLFARE